MTWEHPIHTYPPKDALKMALAEIERLTALHEAAAARAEMAQIDNERLRAALHAIGHNVKAVEDVGVCAYARYILEGGGAMTRDAPYPASFVGPVGPVHHSDIVERLRDGGLVLQMPERARIAAEIERLQRRCNDVLDAYAETATRVMELRAELTVIHDDGRCPSWICQRIEAVLEPEPHAKLHGESKA